MKILRCFVIIFCFSWIFCACNFHNKSEKDTVNESHFETVGYLFWTPGKINLKDISYQHLTTINFAKLFLSPDLSGNLLPINYPDSLNLLVKYAHEQNVKIFVYIGGFNIGDGPGIDHRLEAVANQEESRIQLAHAAMGVVREFNLDGIDIDWEFPDAVEPSLSNFTLLMKTLSDSLHPAGKKLTAAVEAYNLPYTYGIDQSAFEYVDWLNIMGYDGDVGVEDINPSRYHAPYWLAERIFDHWVDERGLPREKAILGVPFYGKADNKPGGSYRSLLAKGANPFADVFDSVYYNGLKTIKEKTVLAKKRGGGIMIWEITGDTTGDYSLLRTIYNTIHEDEN